jgi:hypothetical protein
MRSNAPVIAVATLGLLGVNFAVAGAAWVFGSALAILMCAIVVIDARSFIIHPSTKSSKTSTPRERTALSAISLGMAQIAFDAVEARTYQANYLFRFWRSASLEIVPLEPATNADEARAITPSSR